MKPSKSFSWNSEDTKRFFQETLRVLAPYLVVIIPVLVQQLPKDWAYASVVLFVLQRVRSAVELYLAGK